MRVLVAAMPFAGHAAPMAALARELTGRGHEVVAYTGRRYADRFTAVGASWQPWERAPDFDDADLRATFPQVGDGRGMRAVATNLEHVFLRTGAGQARDIEAAGPVDLLVSDQLAIGCSLVAERRGTPWASVSLVPLSMPSEDLPPFGTGLLPARTPLGRARDAALRALVARTLVRRMDAVLTSVRAEVDLPAARSSALEAFASPQLVLAHGVPELEHPRRDLPPQVHFVGQLAPPPAGRQPPPWWPELVGTGRPLVHVTQGTYDVDPSDLLLPALRGLADADVVVAAATGSGPLPADAVPANARQAEFLPYDVLLPRTSVVVTNGGWGGVLAALGAGVPLVVAGGTLDKPEIARRVAGSGAGVDLRTGRPSPRQVAEAVAEVLAGLTYRERAAAVAASLARHGGTAAAVDLLERLVREGGPVPRAEADPWGAGGAVSRGRS
ncbi:UDP:flavonoid glycosyltransferase YjiC, YdhE family [Geodermatophilus amargosae]|uniref:UDP:flavonoid glycosyltransferase YjiC, YdhE family n=1 Tax=Geodermatophilus amargosae TaxID=1296565 RepID=A0A1I7ACI8_9ACTN|nr:nucleotide disphospho-sugar-binding domain-containing protein [Geodermatophilus amargosae]SFT72667.1 UDP:flavonoid glycosyltransferase YjiC, YdhE family [Geodermatophilus amargosae]